MLKIPPAHSWRKIVSRGKYPLLLIYEINQGLLGTHMALKCPYKMMHYARVQGASYLYEPEVQHYIKWITTVLQTNPYRTLQWLRDYYRVSRQLNLWAKKVVPTIATANKDDLRTIYFAYEKQVHIFWRWGYLPFLIDEAINNVLYDLLTNLGVPLEKFSSAIKILSASKKVTGIKKHELETLQLAARIKKDGINAQNKAINAHIKKWGWKDWWIYTHHPYRKEQLQEELLRLSSENPEHKLSVYERELSAKLNERRKFLNKYNNKKLTILSDILAEYNYWHSAKIEDITRVVYLLEPLFIKLGWTYNLSYKQFIELTPEEVKTEKINPSAINKRIKNNGIIMLRGRTRVLTSAQQIRHLTQSLEKISSKQNVLHGFSIYAGKVRGNVFVVPSGNIDLSRIKIKKGSILVTPMTTVNMIPIVKQASAIVTDEGGLLCHASIISRELKIPCIVGTKISTKVLKNGDLVEVDANKGVVRKIK